MVKSESIHPCPDTVFARALPCLRVCVLTLLALMAYSKGVSARGLSEKEIQRLRTLSELGQEACEHRKYESCQRAFEQAEELLPWAPHRYYIAEALVGQGKLVEGTALWSQILKDNDPDDCHPSVCQAVRKARQRLNDVEPQVPRLRLKLATNYEDLRVRVGELELSSVQIENETRLNPGKYPLVATARGYDELRVDYEFALGQSRELQLVLPSSATQVAAEPKSVPERSAWKTAAGIGTVAMGGLALVGGGLVWSKKQSDLRSYTLGCEPNGCRESDPEVKKIEAQTFNANLLFVAGGALVAIGGALIVWDVSAANETSLEALSTPGAERQLVAGATLGPGAAGLWCRGAF